MYDDKHTWFVLDENPRFTLKLVGYFEKWLARYCNPAIVPKGKLKKLALRCENCKVYISLENREAYVQAIIDYISGMTDRYAIDLFNELFQY